MPPIEILLAILGGTLGLFGLFFVLATFVPARATTGFEVSDPESDTRPVTERIAGVVPTGYLGWIQRQIIFAGRVRDWTPGGFLIVKIVVAVLLGFVGVLILVFGTRVLPPALAVLMGAFTIFLALVGPELILQGRASDRQAELQRALPDTLDQMTIAVEAGLGFDAAMAKAAQNGKGPLAEELIRAIQDMSIGRRRREAYRALEARTKSEDLHRFIRAILQADAYGISIADVLRVQAGEMRMRRRQRAEEKAMSVPVKMVFPLVFCILPVLFIVLLTPAVLGLIDAFSF